MTKQEDPLVRLEHVRVAREAIDALENHCVDAARADGRTWTEVGEVYGMTKQGAQQRFREAIAVPRRRRQK